jgi:probable HAF family extracellular repeat protein
MNILRIALSGFLIATACTNSVRAAAPVRYTATVLGTLGGTNSYGYSINGAGVVVGDANTGFSGSRAFIYDGTLRAVRSELGAGSIARSINESGQITGGTNFSQGMAFLYDPETLSVRPLGTLSGYSSSQGFGINNLGDIAGVAYNNGRERAFLRTTTRGMIDLGTLGGSDSEAYGINDLGIVTGFARVADGSRRAFVYDGIMREIGTLGGTQSIGYAINDKAHVTGHSSLSGFQPSHAFYFDGTMRDLGTLGGASSAGLAINTHGTIVGSSSLAGPPLEAAFIWTKEHGMLDLNSLVDGIAGIDLRSATAINDRGQITGYGNVSGRTHAFLLTPVPVPESSSLAIFVLGFAIQLTRFRLRRT